MLACRDLGAGVWHPRPDAPRAWRQVAALSAISPHREALLADPRERADAEVWLIIRPAVPGRGSLTCRG
jgi:hypothetical protein